MSLWNFVENEMPKVVKQRARPRVQSKLNVLDRIAPIGFGDDDGIHINLYGRSGTGKTTLWATFPKPILAIVCSGGGKPGELRSIDTPEYRKTIRQVTLHESSEMEELLEHATSGVYKTVVLDHASGLQDLILREILGLDRLPEQLSWGLATRDQYGQVALQVKTYLRMQLDLACNVVVVAQERDFNSDGDGEVISPFVASALTPSVVGWLNPAVDYICNTFIRPKMIEKKIKVGKKIVVKQVPSTDKKVEFCLRTGPDSVYATKFRVPRGTELPYVIVNPSYEKIYNLVRGRNPRKKEI